MNLENTNISNSKEKALLGILRELESGDSSEKAYRAIAITKNLINEKSELTKEKELLLNEKEDQHQTVNIQGILVLVHRPFHSRKA